MNGKTYRLLHCSYALNRDVIGPDPGVITPGQWLVLPSEATGGAR